MNHVERQRIVNRIISGEISDTFILSGTKKDIVFRSLNRKQRVEADRIYSDALEESYSLGSYSSDELLPLIFWTQSDQDKYDKISSDISDMKVMIYKSFFNTQKKEAVRGNLRSAEDILRKLIMKKINHNTYTCEGVARVCQIRYIISQSTYVDNRPLFFCNHYWNLIDYDNVLDHIVNLYSDNTIDEKDYREIARTDPWRNIWSMKNSEGEVFGVPAVDLTEEQRTMSMWSSIYDNISDSTEKPTKEIIDDDDSIDGWMILQGRKSDEEIKKSGMQTLGLEDEKTGREVFITARNSEDIKNINNMNSVQSKHDKRERAEAVKKHGHVLEQHMPDTERSINRELIKMRKERG